jgi:SNF2 family DNA or RNA helicase
LNIIIENSTVTISLLDNLKDYQIGNLGFMGFEKRESDGAYLFQTNNPIEILLELIEYLNKINIDYDLCKTCTSLIESYQKTLQGFKKLKELATNYKDGSFNENEIHEFNQSLNKLLSTDRKLKEHQKKAAYHLYLLGNGANFSVPGSGKTSVVLSVYEKLKKEGKVNTLFVVGPASCFGPWRHEFELTLGRKPVYNILAGGGQHVRKLNYYVNNSTKSELYLTTFQTLLYDQNEVKVLFEEKGINIFLVIDEAHYIKRIEGEWAKAVLNIGTLARHKCVLTGTPMPRSYTDAFNLFDFLWPNINVINEDSRNRIRNLEDQRDYNTASDIINDKVGPLFYRVRKIELGLTKQRFHDPIIVAMKPCERQIYDAIETRIENYPKEEYARNIEFVSRLYRGRIIRLRQAISYAGLVRTAIDGYEEDLLGEDSELKEIVKNYDNLEVPSKIGALINQIKKLNNKGHKVVIWAHFIGTLELIKNHLYKNGLNCKMIYGGTPIEREAKTKEESREQIRDEFVDPKSNLDILIANPGACAESISLHKTCQHAIYYDLSYNCAQYLQSLDRIHRVGGSEKKVANYYFLQYEGTIDNDILENLKMKEQKMYEVIEQDFGIYSLDMFGEDDNVEAYQRLFNVKNNNNE